MYRIIGADQKEYGPVSAGQLQQWIAQSRVSRTTKIKPEGATDWQTLGELPEFAAVFNPPGAVPPPPSIPGGSSERAKTSGMAVTSLVMGLLGFCGIFAIVGLILGIVAMTKIKNSNGRLKGSGLAIAGICVSAIMLFFSVLVVPAMLLPALAKAKQRAQSITCMNNARQLDLALIVCASANTNHLPVAATWCDSIQTYVGGSSRAFLCSKGDASQRSHYAFNAALSEVDTTEIKYPSTTVLIFETGGGWNVSGGAELIDQTRHGRTVVVGFADGHVEMVNVSKLPQLRWEP